VNKLIAATKRSWNEANWRVIFRFEEGQAIDVDLIDYH
jgi:plasmid maintenance system killer protein